MKKNRLFVICSLLILYSSTLFAAERITSSQVIVIENDWPPYFFGETQEQLPGFAKELLQQCIPATGYAATFQFYPVNRMYSYLKKGEIDIALFSPQKDREKFVMYGKESLFSSGYRPVVRSETDIKIHSLDDFESLRLGHLAGLKYSPSFLEYVLRRQKEGTLITATMGDSAMKMLLEGIIDVFVDTQDSATWRAKKMNVLNGVKILDYDIKSSDYYITVSRKSPRIEAPQEFLDKFDKCLLEMKQKGQFTEIAEKYGIKPNRP